MSDTPRTATLLIEQNYIGGELVPASFAQQLERELNSSNERIKQLKEAGDELYRWRADIASADNWINAKEAKP